jgi:uncharacterized membrane protein
LSQGSRSLSRAFVAVAILLAVGTAVGLAILWPGDVEPKLGEGLAAKSERAEVERIETFRCSGFGTNRCRRVTVRLKSGSDENRAAVIELGAGGLDPELDVGDQVRVVKGAPLPEGAGGGGSVYSLSDFERRQPMLLLVLAFAALVILFARLRGALSLVGLAFSLAIVLLFVVPAILDGERPLAVAVVGSMAIMLVTITLAHGGGPKSLAAILGTAASLLLTALLAVVFTELTHLTGLSSEEATLLQLNQGNVSLEGLLLAGMVIGALGVLDDVTISQSSTVLALRGANPTLGFGALFGTAMRVGRDHVTATVNTLVLAYVGASLPVLLVFSSGQLGFIEAVNLELVATEVVATLVGSIGLIAAVPITTALASLLALREPPDRLAGLEQAHAH